MRLTFREKSLWLLLLSLLAIFGVYFASVLPTPSAQVTPGNVMTFVGMLIVLVVLQVVGQAILAIASRRELSASVQSDERDALISLKGTRLASYVLTTGVFCSLCLALFVPGNFAFVHVLLAFWVLAQATELLSRLVFYRRGV
jgi:DMSO reductase anchor subunit